MLLRFAHLQKDDSLVPLLPYAAGCFLASVLLTISGIAETHSQALVLATYLIQAGWLLLQVQGVLLIQTYGTTDQTQTIFKIWLVAMHLLDVHRRSLRFYTSMMESLSELGPSPGSVAHTDHHGSNNSNRNSASRWTKWQNGCRTPAFASPLPMVIANDRNAESMKPFSGADMVGKGVCDSSVWTTVANYYTMMFCQSLPSACESLESTGILARAGYYHLNGSGSSHVSSSSGGSRVNRGSSNSHSSLTEGSSSNSAGIREMEYEVAFELFAGLCVSGLMCLVWLGMALRQGGNGRRGAISSVRRMSISLQRFSKQLKGGVEECKMALEAKIDALVEKIKFQID